MQNTQTDNESNRTSQGDAPGVVDLTGEMNIQVEKKPPRRAPGYIFREPRPKSEPVLRVERTIHSHEAQKAINNIFPQGLRALTEIFRNSDPIVKKFGLLYDPITRTKYDAPISMDAKETRENIRNKLNTMLSEMESRYHIYDSWVLDAQDNNIEVEFTQPVVVRFYVTTHESSVFADLFVLFDMSARALSFAEMLGEITRNDRLNELSQMQNDLTNLVKYLTGISLAMNYAKKRKLSKKQGAEGGAKGGKGKKG